MNSDKIREYVDAIRESCDGIEAELDGTAPEPPPSEHPTIFVKPGDNVQAAINDLADTGGIIRAAPGEYRRSLVLLPRADNAKVIVITTDAADGVPAEGVRIGPEYAPGLAIFRSEDDYAPAFEAKRGSGGFAFVGVGFGPQKPDRTVIVLGDDSTAIASDMPHDFVFDRVLMQGDPELGQHRGIMAHASRVQLINSYLGDFHEEGRDSQCLAAWNGGRFLTIDNNYLEGSAENLLFGGGAACSPEMIPQDVTITRNLFSKPLRWKTLEHEPSIKCLLEIKNMLRCHIEGNVFDGCWARDWPSGVAVVFKVSPNGSDYTECQDVVFTNNVIRNVGAVFSVVGSRDAGEPSGRMRGLTIRNNLAYNIDTGDDYKGDGKALPISNPPIGLHVEHNTIRGNNHSLLYWWWDDLREVGEDLVLTDNCADHGAYGITGPEGSGIACLDQGWPNSYTVTGNALRKHPDRTVKLPTGNAVIEADAYDASFGEDHCVVPGSAVDNVVTSDGSTIGADIGAIEQALSPTEYV